MSDTTFDVTVEPIAQPFATPAPVRRKMAKLPIALAGLLTVTLLGVAVQANSLSSAKAELATTQTALTDTKAELTSTKSDLSNAESDLSDAQGEVSRQDSQLKYCEYVAETGQSLYGAVRAIIDDDFSTGLDKVREVKSTLSTAGYAGDMDGLYDACTDGGI